VINPLDRHALEAGMQLKEASGGSLTAVAMAPPAAEQTLTEALAMGADEAILLTDLAFAGGDTLATARVLAAGLKKQGSFDLILCGAESFDGGTAQVGPQLGVLLGMPWVSRVRQIQAEGAEHLLVTVEDEVEVRDLKLQFPVLLTVDVEVNKPRRLSLLGIMAARKRSITVLTVQDVDVDKNEIGLDGSPTQTEDLFSAESTRKIEYLTGNPSEIVESILAKIAWPERG